MPRTRGPRTPVERATDAARTAATLFENLPSSDYADRTLKPIAALLRFDNGTDYLRDDGFERAARAYLQLIEGWKYVVANANSQRLINESRSIDDLSVKVTALAKRIGFAEELAGAGSTLTLIHGGS